LSRRVARLLLSRSVNISASVRKTDSFVQAAMARRTFSTSSDNGRDPTDAVIQLG
jgi:hypothetical protein